MPHATSRDESSGCFERTSVSLCSIRTVLTPGGRSGSLAGAGKARDTCGQPVMCSVAGQGRLLDGRTGSRSHAGKRQKAEEGAAYTSGSTKMTAQRAHGSPGRVSRGKHETSVMRNVLRCDFVPHRAKFPPLSRRRSQGPIPVNIVKYIGRLATGTRHYFLRSYAVAASGGTVGKLEELMWLRRHRERGFADALGWEVGVRTASQEKPQVSGVRSPGARRNPYAFRHHSTRVAERRGRTGTNPDLPPGEKIRT
ncbi:hypothetical protein EDB86DRAFT_2827616 [Lactarius hatsudake]|nr:hypothetical protein EDB86DRAFT_2827616 [Lactarius hatsudake]